MNHNKTPNFNDLCGLRETLSVTYPMTVACLLSIANVRGMYHLSPKADSHLFFGEEGSITIHLDSLR